MNWDVELAKELKSRENKIPIGPVLGNIISVSPLKIAIFNNNAILTEKHCYICSSLIEIYLRKADIKLNSVADHGVVTTSGEVTFKDVLKVGDKVLCLPTSDGQKFFIIDKVVG